MTSSTRRKAIAARFARAASNYDDHADVQRIAANALAARISSLQLPTRPRILEIGCGTGLLTAALAARIGPAEWTITDIAPAMLAATQARVRLEGSARFLCLDGEHPDAVHTGHYDLVCSSLAVQWFDDLGAGLQRLAACLAPGGVLAISTLTADTFKEWRAAHAWFDQTAATPDYPDAAWLDNALPHLSGDVIVDTQHVAFPDGLAFVRSLKGIGATVPRADAQPLSPHDFRRVLARFTDTGATVSYEIAYGVWQRARATDSDSSTTNDPAHTTATRAAATRPTATRPDPGGVFVTGTDTGVGKTLISAILAKAWQADYWKPLQTGVADEPGDTPSVTALAGLEPVRVHAPAVVLQAPLSPWAAAPLEQMTIDTNALRRPATQAPIVIEGAGGLLVPIDDDLMMIDLIAQIGLPVVLVARSGLGTINHTLLSLHALQAAGIGVAGVVMNGPPSPGNKLAIERFGGVPVIAEVPQLDVVDAETIAIQAARMPSLTAVMAGMEARQAKR